MSPFKIGQSQAEPSGIPMGLRANCAYANNTPRDLMSVVAVDESGFQFAEPQNLRAVQHLSFSQIGARPAKKHFARPNARPWPDRFKISEVIRGPRKKD
jgi:hypothetical protein